MFKNVTDHPKTTFAGLAAVVIPLMEWISNTLNLSDELETGIVAILTALVTGTLFRTTDDFS